MEVTREASEVRPSNRGRAGFTMIADKALLLLWLALCNSEKRDVEIPMPEELSAESTRRWCLAMLGALELPNEDYRNFTGVQKERNTVIISWRWKRKQRWFEVWFDFEAQTIEVNWQDLPAYLSQKLGILLDTDACLRYQPMS